MNLEWTPFAIAYIVSSIVALATALVAWEHRSRPGGIAVCWLMLAAAVWSFGNAMEICSVGMEAKTIWSNIEYAGITAVPVAWLAGTLSLAGKSEWFTRRNVLLLLIIPVATQVFVWTNGCHGLMRYNVWLDESGPFAVIVKTYGPWFWIWTAYTYTLLAIGTISVMRTLVGLPGPYRAQATLMAVGVFAPWAANIVYISGLTTVGRPDITPIALVISGLAGTLAILRYRLFDIQPIAWATVAKAMDDGVVVIDYRDRVVAANPAAQAFTGWSGHHAVGKHAAEVMGRWPRAMHALSAVTGSRHEPVMEVDEQDASFEFRFSPLLSSGESIIGRVIVIRDVTERKRTYEEMIRQQRALAAMEEREALARDMHDDVCQVLGYLNLELQSARDKLIRGQTTAVGSDLENLIGVVRGSQSELREYIRRMMGGAESRWELVPKLQELLRGIESRCGICTALTVSEEISDEIIGHAAELQLLRIVQEACANTVKHAGASHLWVRVERLGNIIEIVVGDDGKGFNVVDQTTRTEEGPAGQSSGGLGLSIMRERAERLGGDFTLRSSPGRGTKVRVCIPAKPDGGSS